MTSHILKCTTCVAALLLPAAPVAAQSIAASAMQPQDAATQLEEIVVTGERYERSLQATTTSVAVTTARRIEQEAILSLQDVYNRTANVSETYGSSGFTIRGVAAQGVSGAGDAPLSTVYVDGAPLPTGLLFNGPTDTWDMQQIEILRGPQSTLQGLNALAGSVVLRTRDPGPNWEGAARLIVSDPREVGVAAAVGGPLIADELGLRLAVERRDGDGFTYNSTRDTPEDPVDRLTVRAKLLWTPSALPGLEARLGYTRFESSGGYRFVYTRTNLPDYWDNRVNTSDARNGSDIETDILTLEASYPLTDRLSLTSATSWSKVSEFTEYDSDLSPASEGYGYADRTYETLTQEFRLNYDGERLSGLLGAFYYNRDQHFSNFSRVNVETPVSTISYLLQSNGLDAATAGYVANLYAAALPVIPVDYTGDYPSKVKSYALFGDARWRLTDRLTLLGGFRWDHEENAISSVQTAAFVGAYPDPANYGAPLSPMWFAVSAINLGVADLVAQAAGTSPESAREFDAFLPKLGVRYEFTDDLALGFVVQRGYRSGGSSTNLARAQNYAYDPEYTWNYEASLRSAWLDGALILNANAYYVDWTDQQVSVNFGSNLYDYHTVNAGKSSLYGFEIEGSWRMSPALDVYGAVGRSKTEFEDFEVSLGNVSDLSGTEFIYAPAWTLSAGANYRWTSGFVANLNANYRSAVYTEAGASQAASRVSSRTVVNGKFGYETGRWGAYLYGENLFDADYASYVSPTLQQAVLGRPRVVGLILQANW
jgi:outer membrane receptor protein involved in Fe transport